MAERTVKPTPSKGEPARSEKVADAAALAATFPPAARQALLVWFSRVRRDLPWRRSPTPYGVWVSELMLQQTRVAVVVDYWIRWMKRFPDVEALASADEDDVLAAWAGLGYYARARNLHRAAKLVLAAGGSLPTDAAGLKALPGVGPYTRGAILSIGLGLRAGLVDGNVSRVLARWFRLPGDPTRSPIQRRNLAIAEHLVPVPGPLPPGGPAPSRGPIAAEGLLPFPSPEPDPTLEPRGGWGGPSAWNQSLMELGATVCLPRTPRCDRCPVAPWCAARTHGDQPLYPSKRKKTKVRERRALCLALSDGDDRWLVARRPARGLLGGLWEFPMACAAAGLPAARQRLLTRIRAGIPIGTAGALPTALQTTALGTAEHRFTHLALTAQLEWVRLAPDKTALPLSDPGAVQDKRLSPAYVRWQWVPRAELGEKLGSALMQRLLAHLPAQGTGAG